MERSDRIGEMVRFLPWSTTPSTRGTEAAAGAEAPVPSPGGVRGGGGRRPWSLPARDCARGSGGFSLGLFAAEGKGGI